MWWYTRRHFVGGRILPGLLVIPTLFYWCVRLDQNVGFRFFYYLPLGAAIVLALNWKLLGAHRSTVTLVSAAAWALLLFPPLRREFRTFRDLQAPDLVAISKDLRAVPHTGVLLSSEAGILPYYSEWQTVDPWGLNTPAFAHHFFQPEQVAELQPSLVHTHPDSTDGCGIQPEWKVPYAARNWTALTRNISAGIDRSRYDVLQTSYGSERYRRRKQWMYAQGDVACWFVRRGIAEHDAVVRILQNHHASLAP